MIKNILYVEDGSIDVDALETLLGEETKVIVYRQGAAIPKLEQINPINTKKDDTLDEVKNICEKCITEIERNDEMRYSPYYKNSDDIYKNAIKQLIEALKRKED